MYQDVILSLLGGLACVFYGHFLLTKKESRADFNTLTNKVVALENTAVKEAEVRILIHEVINPVLSTMNEIKGSIERVEKNMISIELQRAYDKGIADALAKGAT